MANKPEQTLGEEIIGDLRELCDTLEKNERIEDKFTVRTVELDLQPREYDGRAVKRTRKSLNVSQAVFAMILAASVETVESWEQGLRKPSPMACRLLDLINQHRDHWIRVLHKSTKEASLA